MVPNLLIPAERCRVWLVIRGRRTPPVQRQHRRRCLETLYRNLCSANTSRGGEIVSSAGWKGGWVRPAVHSFFLRRLWKAAPWLCRNPELATPVWTSIRRNFAPWKWNFRVDGGGLIKKQNWWCFVASSGVKWRRKLFWDDRVIYIYISGVEGLILKMEEKIVLCWNYYIGHFNVYILHDTFSKHSDKRLTHLIFIQ